MLHWNIHSWRDDSGAPNRAAVAELIRATAPDVVSLVEVSEPWGEPSVLSDLSDQLGYHWVFIPALEYGGQPATLGYGNALLTRLPITAVQQWQIHAPGRYEGTEPSEPRTAAWARVTVGDTRVWVGSTHLPADDADDRARALSRFAVLLRKLDGPWLVCGDFNTPASTWRTEIPGVSVSPDPPRPTFPARRPRRPIDYCLAAPGLPAPARVLRARGSDHLPVLVSAGPQSAALERLGRGDRGAPGGGRRSWWLLPRRRTR